MSRLFYDDVTGAKTTATCLITGHRVKSAGYSADYHFDDKIPVAVKGRRGFQSQGYRSYYVGELLYCEIASCTWFTFLARDKDPDGHPVPYKTTKIIGGIEHELGEPERGQDSQVGIRAGSDPARSDVRGPDVRMGLEQDR